VWVRVGIPSLTRKAVVGLPSSSAATREQDLKTVAHGISKAVATALDDLDLVGHAFGERVRNRVVEVVEDLVLPHRELVVPRPDEVADSRDVDMVLSQLQAPLRLGAIRGVVDRGELLLEEPRDTDLRVRCKHFHQSGVLLVGELVSVLRERRQGASDATVELPSSSCIGDVGTSVCG
jgi:hypothetical protein